VLTRRDRTAVHAWREGRRQLVEVRRTALGRFFELTTCVAVADLVAGWVWDASFSPLLIVVFVLGATVSDERRLRRQRRRAMQDGSASA
jgi:hypothetical protein